MKKNGIKPMLRLFVAKTQMINEPMTMKEVIERLSEKLNVVERSVYRYVSANVQMSDEQLQIVADFLSTHIEDVSIESLKELLYPTTVAVEQE